MIGAAALVPVAGIAWFAIAQMDGAPAKDAPVAQAAAIAALRRPRKLPQRRRSRSPRSRARHRKAWRPIS